MSTQEYPDPPTGLAFNAFLDACMATGIRPPGEPRARRRAQEFGQAAGGVTATQVRNWVKGGNVPPSLAGIELALFGTDQTYLPAWRRELQATYQTAKGRLPLDNASTGPTTSANSKPNTALIPNPIEPQILASLSGAKGIIHIVWLISLLISNDISSLISQSWPFADLFFGPFGLLLCYGTVMYTPWARFLGSFLCALGVVLAVLWIIDSYKQDLPAQQFAMGGISLIYYVYGLYFYLKIWPTYYANKDLYEKPF